MYVYPLGNPRTSQWKEIVKIGLSLSRQTQTLHGFFVEFLILLYTVIMVIRQSQMFLLETNLLLSYYVAG